MQLKILEMVEDNNPLVSINVITYNSSKFVLETLESAKAQTYQNIELIVSDDCSTDNTVDICREWIEKNKDRFVRTELITVEKNTGIPANCNRAVKASKGEWIKGIAGDDALIGTCVEDNLEFIKNDRNKKIIVSMMKIYKDSFCESNLFNELNLQYIKFKKIFDLSSNEQFNHILKFNFIAAPSVFINKQIFCEIGGYDESIMYEDYPMWIKILMSGYKFYFLDKETVMYRRHSNSIQTISKELLFKIDIIKSLRCFDIKYRIPYLDKYSAMKLNCSYYTHIFFHRLKINRNVFYFKYPYILLMKLFKI